MKTFLILGRTGVGKSSFINSVFGTSIAKTHTDEACTKIVTHYAITIEHGEICLIDTPGLGEEDINLDYHYLNLVKQSIKNKKIDKVLYVTALYETRFRSSEKLALKLITEVLGSDIWNSSWLVFTFASFVEKDKLLKVTTNKIRLFKDYINHILGKEFYRFEKIIRIDNKKRNWSDQAKPIRSAFRPLD